ncbi:unnamed protein product, partial [Phaeothamnion confervicola]
MAAAAAAQGAQGAQGAQDAVALQRLQADLQRAAAVRDRLLWARRHDRHRVHATGGGRPASTAAGVRLWGDGADAKVVVANACFAAWRRGLEDGRRRRRALRRLLHTAMRGRANYAFRRWRSQAVAATTLVQRRTTALRTVFFICGQNAGGGSRRRADRLAAAWLVWSERASKRYLERLVESEVTVKKGEEVEFLAISSAFRQLFGGFGFSLFGYVRRTLSCCCCIFLSFRGSKRYYAPARPFPQS